MHHHRVELVFLVGVRAGHDVGGSGIGGHAHHGDRFLQAFRTVVNAWEDVAVNIDHSFMRSNLRYSVLRSMPRICAALLLLPPVAASTLRIWSSSASASVSTGLSRDSMAVSASSTVSRSIRSARMVR